MVEMELKDFTKEEIIEIIKRNYLFIEGETEKIIRELIRYRYRTRIEQNLKESERLTALSRNIDFSNAKDTKELIDKKLKWLKIEKKYQKNNEEYNKINEWFHEAKPKRKSK